VVESNWGKDRHAYWYLNLKKNSYATIQVDGRTIHVEVYDAQGDEYARLWKFATERHPPFLRYQEMTKRRIPIIVFQPSS
jgi:deazaflavin-dependent oxidoreductase (nitroreductase family)